MGRVRETLVSWGIARFFCDQAMPVESLTPRIRVPYRYNLCLGQGVLACSQKSPLALAQPDYRKLTGTKCQHQRSECGVNWNSGRINEAGGSILRFRLFFLLNARRGRSYRFYRKSICASI